MTGSFRLLGSQALRLLIAASVTGFLFLPRGVVSQVPAEDAAREIPDAQAHSGPEGAGSSTGAAAEAVQPDSAVRPNMHKAYAAFRELQKLMISRDRFVDPANEEKVRGLIEDLRTSFNDVQNQHLAVSREPGFAATLQNISDMLSDAKHRFDEGKRGYALWRLRTVSSHCVSCHTRHEVPMQFSDDSLSLDELSPFERGEFLIATRQFDKAGEAFKEAILAPEGDSTRMEALRNWLLVHTRVQPDPDAALTELTKILASVPLKNFDRDEVQSWIVSLRRWKSENRNAKIPDLAKAENLVRQGLGANDPIAPRVGTVELLRATGILHRLLEQPEGLTQGERGHALYLLGLAYSELPFFFINELPEMFLEQSIREVPGTDTAQKAFRRYREVVTMAFTGSGGTRIPDEVLLKLKELHEVAYATVSLDGKV